MAEEARATGPEQAAFRRRWGTERRRAYDRLQTSLASPAHIAASDQAHAAMMDAHADATGHEYSDRISLSRAPARTTTIRRLSKATRAAART